MGRKGPKPKTYNHFQVTLDKFLGSKNLWRKAIAKDGSCLFRAVAEQVLLSQAYHHQVRLQCADYISRHRDDFKEFLTVKVEEYLDRLRDGQLWGGEVELVVFSKMYRRSIVVFNQQVNQVQEQIFYSPEDEAAGRRPEDLLNPIFLAYSDGNHYDSVYLKKHRSNMAFCQSVVYSLLYEKVFEETLSQSSKQRLKTLYDSEIQKLAAEDKGDKHLTFLSKTYPIGVLEGMGQNCFSNTPLHVYQRERDCIEQQDRNVAAAIQFQVGDKCLVPVPGEQSCYYNGEIATPVKPNGCHMVYIFEVGEQWEIPCKDITVPGPSPSATPVRRTTGPSHAWSKAHQRIQPGLPRGKAIPEDTPTSLSSSPPEQLVTDISPPDLQHTHHNHLPSHIITNTRTTPTMTSSLTTTDTSTNMGPKMNQSTKPHNKSVPVPSGSVPVASTSRLPSGKMGGADVGVVLQHGVRSDDQQSRRSGVGGGGKVRSNGGSGILGSAPHGFLVASRDKPLPKTQKVAGESDKPANLPGRTIISEPPQPPNIDQQSQPVVVPPSVVTMPSHPASYPTLYIKTAPSVPRGSLSTSDESSTSSNEECGNGHPSGHPSGHIPVNPSQTTANTATGPIPLFFSHPIGRYVLPMLPEGRPSVHIPPAPPVNPHSAAQVASVLERPLMHAPMPQSQPPLVQQPTPIVKSHLHQHQVIQTVRPPPGSGATTMVVSTPSPQHKIPPQGNQGNEIGRESPYMDSQLLQRKSSQPEEAWPMVGEEDREKDQPPSTSSPPAHIHPRFMFPFNMANAPPHDQQGIPIMQPPHMATHPVMPPGGPTPPGVPVSMPHIVPFILTHQPFPQPHHLQHQHMIEVDTDTKEVQTSPYPSPQPLMKDKEIDVRPLTFSMSTQCTGVNRKEAESNTVLVEGINIPLYVPNDIKPPNVSIDNMDMDAQICLVTQYAMQCLRLYEVADRDGAKSALNIVQSLSESVHNEIQEREKSLREEIKEEVREEVRMELIEEVREEMKTTMRDEIMNEVRSEFGEVLSHKPLNMDEQNFLQLFTNSQQGLRETIHDGRMVLPEEHGRYGGSPIPPNLQNIGFVDKLHHQLIGSQGDTDDVIQPSGNHDNDPAGVQEVSVPPFHQMPPNPMMVPPGARPMVVTMPGMPWYPYMPFPMFMPPHHQMNVLPPPVLPPHMTPDQTNDDLEEHQPDQTECQEDHLPTGDNHHTILESTTTTGDIELLEGEQEVMVTEGETDDILPQNNLTSTVPASDTLDTHPVNISPTHQLTAFPSADLHTGLDDIELPSTIAGSDLTTTNSPPPPQPSLSLSLSSSSSSKHTVELVTPQVSPYTHSLDDISPTPQPTSTGHHGDDELNNTHWDDGTSNDRDVLSSNSHTIRPGLPCRRRDINDIDRVLSSADDGREVEEELKEDETTASHVIQRQPSNKGKARHGNIHRGNKSRDGTYHGGGGGGDGTGRAGKAHNKASDRRHTLSNQQSSSSTATEPSSKTSVTSGGHQSTRSHTHTPTSSTSPDLQTASSHSQSKTGQSRVHTTTAGGKSRTQTTASSNGTTSSSSTVRNSSGEGVKKNAPDTKLSGEVVKVTTGKDSSSGGSSVKGGSGASVRGNGGKAGNKGRGPGVVGGRDRKNDTSNSVGGDDGRQAASVATSVAASKIEEKDLASDEVSSEGKKNLRQNYSRSGSNQKYGRQKDSRKPIGSVQVGGGGGGRGGHWTHRQPHTTGDNDTRHKLRVNTTASKTVREQGDSKSKAKRVNSVPDSGTTQQQQQSTRCSRQSCLKTLSDTQQQLLPSFKNLYSSNQDDEIENELFTHSSQESWPSMTQHCDDLTPLPSQYLPSSPASLSLTGVCHQSSPHLPKHFSGPNSSSNLPSYHHNTSDIQKDLLTFFPALLSTVTTDAEQAT